MKTIKGPSIFLAQFVDNKAPFNDLSSICQWAAGLGYQAVQLPTWETRLMDLNLAAESKTYADELRGKVAACGLHISELATHLQGQLVAVHPAYAELFGGFSPPQLASSEQARIEWAKEQVKYAAKASQNLGLNAVATFSGSLLWPFAYPWPQRPEGLVAEGFKELAKRWTPILNYYEECGVDLCYEIHPSEDLHDGVTFEMFLAATKHHKRANILYDPSHFVLQQLDYLSYIDIYHPYIKMFHVKDAEFRPSGKAGVYGGYQDWAERPGRFRSLGDGQVDFSAIFSKLTQYDYDSWAVLEWECCLKNPEDGAREGAEFIKKHIIRVTEKSFDDFAGSQASNAFNKKLLGI